MFIRAKEQRIAYSVQREESTIDFTSKLEDVEEVECVCLECSHTFEDENPDECPLCGSSDLDVA
jgi:rubrerythrin